MYLETFQATQSNVVDVTERVALQVKPGVSELEIADRLQSELNDLGLTECWYPILICAGEHTGKPFSRRYHLPSSDVIVQANDIIFVDSTPLRDTVWWNWSKTVAVGDDEFFHDLCASADEVAQLTFEFGNSSAHTIGELFDFCMQQIGKNGFVLLDYRNDVGHSIFQVPAGQKVEDTPVESRLFISDEYRHTPLKGILSIEPQVGKRHPGDGIMYGAKQQRILIR